MGAFLSRISQSAAGTEKAAAAPSKPLAFRHYPSAQSKFEIPLIANGNAYLGDVFSSDAVDPLHPISCGLYRLEPGVPLDYTYTYHEMKIILEGDFTISDETGQKVRATAGDVFNFPKGAKIHFETEKGGLAFYTGQRKEGTA